MQLKNFENAIYHFKQRCQVLGFDAPITQEFNVNNRRYKILELDGYKYLVMFKRDFFMTYGQFFPNEKDKIGESVNRQDLKQALANGVTKLLYLYENGSAYTADISHLLNHWHLRETLAEEKEVYSFGLSHLKRWE